MKIFISKSAEIMQAEVRAKKNTSTQEIRDEIESICERMNKKVVISRMPKSMRMVDKTFVIEGSKNDVVDVAAAYYDTDPDSFQLEEDWDVVFKEKE